MGIFSGPLIHARGRSATIRLLLLVGLLAVTSWGFVWRFEHHHARIRGQRDVSDAAAILSAADRTELYVLKQAIQTEFGLTIVITIGPGFEQPRAEDPQAVYVTVPRPTGLFSTTSSPSIRGSLSKTTLASTNGGLSETGLPRVSGSLSTQLSATDSLPTAKPTEDALADISLPRLIIKALPEGTADNLRSTLRSCLQKPTTGNADQTGRCLIASLQHLQHELRK